MRIWRANSKQMPILQIYSCHRHFIARCCGCIQRGGLILGRRWRRMQNYVRYVIHLGLVFRVAQGCTPCARAQQLRTQARQGRSQLRIPRCHYPGITACSLRSPDIASDPIVLPASVRYGRFYATCKQTRSQSKRNM